jgi:RNA polymerase sigma factor (sigma-70 family)
MDARERALVHAIRVGDDMASAPLYGYLRPGIEKTLRSMLRISAADVEDLLQNTLEQVVLTIARGGFDGRCKLTTWARALAVHVALNAARRRRREQRLFSDWGASNWEVVEPAISTEGRLEARSSLRHVRAALFQMNPVYAQVTHLRYELGYSVAEVATKTHSSASTTRTRIRRARQKVLCRATNIKSA